MTSAVSAFEIKTQREAGSEVQIGPTSRHSSLSLAAPQGPAEELKDKKVMPTLP